jgi:exosortase
LILKLGRSLWDREQYQFFPLMVVGILIVGSERWRDLPWRRARPGPFGVAAIVLSLGLTVLVAGEMLWLRPAAGGALLLILAGLAWRIGGGLLLRAMMPVGLLLATMIPPPGEQELTITLWLQQLAVQASGRLLDGLRVPHVRAGNVLEIPGRRLLLEQACSGINSLTSVLAFVLLWGVWQRRPLWRIALLLPVAAGYVLASNIGRITLEAWLKTRWHIDVLDGTLHEILGVLLFIASVGLTCPLHEPHLYFAEAG